MDTFSRLEDDHIEFEDDEEEEDWSMEKTKQFWDDDLKWTMELYNRRRRCVPNEMSNDSPPCANLIPYEYDREWPSEEEQKQKDDPPEEEQEFPVVQEGNLEEFLFTATLDWCEQRIVPWTPEDTKKKE